MQKNDCIRSLMRQYGNTPITERGLSILYDRAQNRGYDTYMIYIGLKTVICKNYRRSEYIPPQNQPEYEHIHERMYIEDWEFRGIMKGDICNEC